MNERYIYRNRHGCFYFRYVFPFWLRELNLGYPREIRLSLRTNEKLIAQKRCRYLWCHIDNFISPMRDYPRVNVQCFEADQFKQFRDNSLELHRSDRQDTILCFSTGNFGPMNEKEKIIDYVMVHFRSHFMCGKNSPDDMFPWVDDYDSFSNEIRDDFSLLYDLNLLGKLDHIYFTNLDEMRKIAATARDKRERREIREAVETYASGSRHNADHVDQSSINELKHNADERILISEALDKFLSYKQFTNHKTSSKYSLSVKLFIENIGDLSISQITKDHVNAFKTALDKLTHKHGGQVSSLTNEVKQDYLNKCGAVINDFCGENPFKAKILRYKKTDKIPFSSNELFSNEELRTMFSHPLFVEGEMSHPYQYWTPLIALYTGCRENEIAQLHVKDVKLEGDIYYLDINDKEELKSVKTSLSRRKVPIHPKLIELGFIEFTELLKKPPYKWIDKDGYYRFFKGLNYVKGHGYRKNLSYWFNGEYKNGKWTGFKHQFGFDIPKGSKKNFHGFRHICATSLQEAEVSREISYSITGHIDGFHKASVGDQYRHSDMISQKYDAICKLNFDDILKNVRPFFKIVPKQSLIEKKTLKPRRKREQKSR